MNKKEAGKLGGLATYKKYGREWMVKIGKRGAAVFYQRYFLQPTNLNDFAIVNKETGEVINYLNGQKP